MSKTLNLKHATTTKKNNISFVYKKIASDNSMNQQRAIAMENYLFILLWLIEVFRLYHHIRIVA